MSGPRFRWTTYEVDVHRHSPLAQMAKLRTAIATSPDMVRVTIDLPDLSGYLSPREKADALLTVAAEVEHALLVQYLYAAYSLKRRDDPTLSDERRNAVTKWRQAIRAISEEEMGHLMIVQNLRRVLGLGPTFAREQFPMLSGLFPFDFHLQPLTQKSLAQYVVAESPSDDSNLPRLSEIIAVATGNGAMPVNHVGILYGLLGVIFAASPTDINRDATSGDSWYAMVRDIAIAAYQQNPSEGAWHLNAAHFDPTTFPQQADASDFSPATAGGVLTPPPADPPPNIRVWRCANQDDAKEALRDIGLQGEGAAQGGSGEKSHFLRFYCIYTGKGDYCPENDYPLPFPKDEWVPTYSAPTDPVISDDMKLPNAISEPKAQAYALLSNLYYAFALGLLNQYLVTEPVRRAILKFEELTLAGWAVDMMRKLGSLARTLANLPRSKAGPEVGNAALPFDLPPLLIPPVARHDQWDLLVNRLQAIIGQEDLIIATYNDNTLTPTRDTHKKQLEQLKQLLAQSEVSP